MKSSDICNLINLTSLDISNNKLKDLDNLPADAIFFHVGQKGEDQQLTDINGFTISQGKSFGNIDVYSLKK